MGYITFFNLNFLIIKRFYSSKATFKIMKYLNVAEKNDAAKNIAAILSKGNSNRVGNKLKIEFIIQFNMFQREGLSPYNKIYEFNSTVLGENCQMIMTSVSGHLLNYEFVSTYRSWQSCNPATLFDAPVIKSCSKDYEKIKVTFSIHNT